MSGSAGPGAGFFGRAEPGLRLLDEAVRLLDLVQAEPSCASASAPDADGDTDGRHRGGECRLCPVCRGLAALREANPDAVARMSRAVTDLATAIGDFVAGPERAQPERAQPEPAAETVHQWYATRERGTSRGTARTSVQRIDVTE